MKKHVLKTDPKPFNDVWYHKKKCEIRKDDRSYQVGDILCLRETIHNGKKTEINSEKYPLKYTGSKIVVRVTHKLKGYGIKKGWCILSFEIIDQDTDFGI